jgi:hypothetical protein
MLTSSKYYWHTTTWKNILQFFLSHWSHREKLFICLYHGKNIIRYWCHENNYWDVDFMGKDLLRCSHHGKNKLLHWCLGKTLLRCGCLGNYFWDVDILEGQKCGEVYIWKIVKLDALIGKINW